MLVSVSCCWAQNSADAQIDALYEEFSNYEGADGVKLGPMMMKMVHTLSKSDKDMTEEQRKFFLGVKKMVIVEMSECPAAEKSKFQNRMQNLTLDGFAKVENIEGMQTVTYYHLLNGKVDILVIGIFEKDTFSFSVYEGSFDEAFAKEFGTAQGNSPIKKQEQPQK